MGCGVAGRAGGDGDWVGVDSGGDDWSVGGEGGVGVYGIVVIFGVDILGDISLG